MCAKTSSNLTDEFEFLSAYRIFLLLDIEQYSAQHRDDMIRARLRTHLRQLATGALGGAGIADTQYETQTIGDGLLVTIDAAVGKPRILSGVMRLLSAGLREWNREATPAEHLRVRLVLHAGDVLIDADGPLGDQVNFAFRLLDAEQLRTLLKYASGPLIVCVSDAVFQVIAQRHEGLNPAAFEPVWFEAKGIRALGWVQAPGEPGLAARAGLSAPGA